MVNSVYILRRATQTKRVHKCELGLDPVDAEHEFHQEFPLGGRHEVHGGILDLTELRPREPLEAVLP